MVKFIHKDFGTAFFVDESRVNEYKAAGHKPAAETRRKPGRKPKTDTDKGEK